MASTVFRPGLFSGQVAIVTGGGSGIGFAIARELAELGAKVVIASRNLERVQAAADKLNRSPGISGDPVMALQTNIRKPEEVKTMVATTLSRFKRLDILVNNAGGQFPGPLAGVSPKGWHAVIDTNLTATKTCLIEAYEQWMRDNSGGRIINIIACVERGFPNMAHSGAARAAVENLTRSLAIEWAENGIRINAIAPGIIYSDTAEANYKGEYAGILTKSVGTIPAARLGTTDEVASAAAFLCSPGASFISGATMVIDGAARLYSRMWEVPAHDNWPAPYEKAKL